MRTLRTTNRLNLLLGAALLAPFGLGTSARADGAPTPPAPAATPAAAAPAQGQKPAQEDPEAKLGRENAAENDKQVKLIQDKDMLERVNRIGQEIAKVANSAEIPALWGTSQVKQFNYTFKVVDDKDVNAYSLPGGYIYVNKGLLDYVHSDDELAGVLAHEVAHAAHHHMMKLMHEQSAMQKWLIPALVLPWVTKTNTNDMASLFMAGQMYMLAKLNTYGIEAEKDADQTGAKYLLKTKYNPVGLLTFMERLARQELLGPDKEQGIYRTHPPSDERAHALIAELGNLKVALNRRDVDPAIRAEVTAADLNGAKGAQVAMNKTVIASMVADGSTAAEERAKALAQSVNRLFDDKLQMYELSLSADKTRVLARRQPIIQFTQADADAQKSSPQDLAKGTLAALRALLWQEQCNSMPPNSSGGRTQ